MNKTIIQLGQKIMNTGRYSKTGYVFRIHGEQKPETVGSMSGVVSYGGGAEFDLVNEDGTITSHLPESIVRNGGAREFQITDEIINQEQIDYWLNFANRSKQLAEIEKQDAATKRAALREQLKKDNPHLILVEKEKYNGRIVATKNIRKELKALFPNTKFSITSDQYSGGDSISVSWTDGPTVAEVETVSGKYSAGSFDGMEDLYTYSHDVWNDLFGDAKYVSESRTDSIEAIAHAIEIVAADYGSRDKPTADQFKSGGAWSKYPNEKDRDWHNDWQSLIHQALVFISYKTGKPVQICTSCKKQDAYANPYECFSQKTCLTCHPDQIEWIEKRQASDAARAVLIETDTVRMKQIDDRKQAELTNQLIEAAEIANIHPELTEITQQLLEVAEVIVNMDQDVFAKSLAASISPELPDVLEDEFIVYSEGICFASVCTTMTTEDAEKEINKRRPTGIHSGWKLSKEAFASGHANPCQCDTDSTRRHMLFNC